MSNHGGLFDLGTFTVVDGMRLIGRKGTLRSVPGPVLNVQHLAYRREHPANMG